MTTPEQQRFSDHLEWASAIVATWPKWKQRCLGWKGVDTSEEQKIAFIAGMARAFSSAAWPAWFSEDDICVWSRCGRIADRIIHGGDFIREECLEVLALCDNELNGEI